MKRIESILLAGCAYTVAIVALFFCFAAISSFTEARIGFGQFFTILLFGQIISVAGYILKNAKWNLFLRYALHYSVLFLAFIIIFVINGNVNSSGAAAIFSAIMIFTFFYAIILLLAFAIKKSVLSVEKKLPQKSPKNKQNNSYTPRYK